MKKLWQKHWQLDKTIETFETQGDLVLDQQLVVYDVYGSLAHAKGLVRIGILSAKEFEILQKGLKNILALEVKGNFLLQPGDEDVHTKIENFLTEKYGEVGQKIHTGRSRNDQVLTAIRLYTKTKLLEVYEQTHLLVQTLLVFAVQYQNVLMPGYTHMQKAMPSSMGLWAAAIAEELLDDLIFLKAAYELNNQSPLGSAAGYGVPLPLDREYTAQLLGFERVQNNPIYCQNSRGKIEAVMLASLISVLADLNKFASDILLFTTSEFSFLKVADELCSGSSIMPQKKNVDVAELLRSKVHVVLGNYVQLVSLSSNLISGYNRDLQDSKKPLFESFPLVISSVQVAAILVANISVNQKVVKSALTSELLTTHQALAMVQKGIPFREAYQRVATSRSTISMVEQSKVPGVDLQNGKKRLQTIDSFFKAEKDKYAKALHNLLLKGGE